jgi:hypothetical protein
VFSGFMVSTLAAIQGMASVNSHARTVGATVKLTGDSRQVPACPSVSRIPTWQPVGLKWPSIWDDVEVERQSAQDAVQPVRAKISRLHRIYAPRWVPKFYSRDARYASSELILSNSFGR